MPGYHDSNGLYHAFNAVRSLPLHNFREVDANGAVGAIAANGGILASDTTPIMRNISGKVAQEISWAASNSDPILCETDLPADFDGTQDVTLELVVNSGTTDAASFTVLSNWDGGTNVSDTATDGAKSATSHAITMVIAAADIPDRAKKVAFHFTPAAHTTNAIQLQGVRMFFTTRAQS